MLLESVRVLLSGVIDYAGLFPPAGLNMSEAVSRYRRYALGPESWMLGRFVVPASRLLEFQTVLLSEPPPTMWKLSALAGPDVTASVSEILAFNAHVRDAQVDVIEARAGSPDAIREQARGVPDGFTVYWEIPSAGELPPWLEAVAAAGHRAKIRTGGVTEDQFPSPSTVAHFIRRCDGAKVAFKATAGLHHAIRGVHRLTYEENSASCTMHGFLNVFLAAAFVWAGISEDETGDILTEPADTFRFSRIGVAWRQYWISNAQVQSARARLLTAFGSCSFEEPVTELQDTGLL
jgi:hypothetical protein